MDATASTDHGLKSESGGSPESQSPDAAHQMSYTWDNSSSDDNVKIEKVLSSPSSSSSSGQEQEGKEEEEEEDDDDEGEEDPYTFHQRVSDISDYQPSNASSPSSSEAEDASHQTGRSQSILAARGEIHNLAQRPKKRPVRPSLDLGFDTRPLKRVKGSFNRDYLALLNEDIEDAAARYIPSEDAPPLEPSQIGLTWWTSLEKDVFFDSLARLGRDDAAGIAARIGTKCELEVRQYLHLLNTAYKSCRDAGQLEPLYLADIPAALELSVLCCHALDAAADAVALRQENYEEGREEVRWRGATEAVITHLNCPDGSESAVNNDNIKVEEATDEPEANIPSPTFATTWEDLFIVKNWLTLSERVFMNAPFEDGNWQSVGEPPNMRATALDDFFTLARSMLTRLISTTLFVAMSRLRSKQGAFPWVKDQVRRRDVEAAAASLGLSCDRRVYWVGCPRRLRLQVLQDLPSSFKTDEGDANLFMSYDQVEQALSAPIRGYRPPGSQRESSPDHLAADSSDDAHYSDSSASISSLLKQQPAATDSGPDDLKQDSEDQQPEEQSRENMPPSPVPPPNLSTTQSDTEAVREALEITRYSALHLPDTTRTRRALVQRIKAELRQERYADALDQHASLREEKRLWALLGCEPPAPLLLIKGEDRPQRPAPYVWTLEDVHPVGKDWREKLDYVAEWEGNPEAWKDWEKIV